MKKILTLIILLTVLVTSCGKESKESGNIDGDTVSQNNDEEKNIINPTFYTLEGEEVDLASFQGKPLVLNLWASWCPPCKAELPDFQEVYNQYGGDVNFVFVSMIDGARETKETALDFINENNYDLPFYFDTNQQVAFSFRVTGIPATYFINSDGTQYRRQVGMLDKESLIKVVGELIKAN